MLTGPEAVAAAKEAEAKRARRMEGEVARRRAEKLWHRRQWRAFKRRAKQEGDREARMASAAAAAREVPDMTAEEARARYLRALRQTEDEAGIPLTRSDDEDDGTPAYDKRFHRVHHSDGTRWTRLVGERPPGHDRGFHSAPVTNYQAAVELAQNVAADAAEAADNKQGRAGKDGRAPPGPPTADTASASASPAAKRKKKKSGSGGGWGSGWLAKFSKGGGKDAGRGRRLSPPGPLALERVDPDEAATPADTAREQAKAAEATARWPGCESDDEYEDRQRYTYNYQYYDFSAAYPEKSKRKNKDDKQPPVLEVGEAVRGSDDGDPPSPPGAARAAGGAAGREGKHARGPSGNSNRSNRSSGVDSGHEVARGSQGRGEEEAPG